MILGQDSSAQESKYFILESNLGLTINDNTDSRIIGGFGLWNYLNIKDIKGKKRNGALGLSVPLRLIITSQNKGEEINNENSFSIAPLFRVSIQQHPVKDKLWFFMGAGPEIKINWLNGSATNMLMFQQEYGLKLFNKSAILPNNEVGFSISWPLQKKGWDENLRCLLFFIRMSVF